jgi:hypothetical protein
MGQCYLIHFDSAAPNAAAAPRLPTILRLHRTGDKGGRIGSMYCTGSFVWVSSQSVDGSGNLRWTRPLRTHSNAVDVLLCV